MESMLYDIKDAARYLNVTPSTLRYWESEGLVRCTRNRDNDYRQYSLHDLIDASEIAFYRRLGVSMKELASYRSLSARDLDDALARTMNDVEQRIADLEAMRSRLAQQRSLDACAEELLKSGMRPGTPTIECLDAIDYHAPDLWPLLVDEPWRYGVLVHADEPNSVRETVVDTPLPAGKTLWRRSDIKAACLECLLLVDPNDLSRSNAPALFAKATQQNLKPRLIVGSYLLTATGQGAVPYEIPATNRDDRWDYYRAWVVG